MITLQSYFFNVLWVPGCVKIAAAVINGTRISPLCASVFCWSQVVDQYQLKEAKV